jgi:hypothetical protein
MDKKYFCYCGLYCENCAIKAKVHPAAKVLYNEMKKAEVDKFIHMLPGGEGFWPFLKNVAEDGVCTSCREGAGNPGCAIRICAKEKNVEMCALCESYPCERFDNFYEEYSTLKEDNAFLRDKGMEVWLKMQEERRLRGFSYADEKGKSI